MKTKADPTGQAKNRRKATRHFDARLKAAQSNVLTRFKAIPFSVSREKPVINQEGVVYDYQIAPEQLNQLRKDIQLIVNEQLLETNLDDPTPQWWYKADLELPYRQGTLEETNNFNQLIALAISLGLLNRARLTPQRIPIELVLTSTAYRQALNGVYVEGFNNVKGLSDKVAKQVFTVINNGIKAGVPRSDITKMIRGRFEVGLSDAKRIADTEINKAYNDAKTRATEVASNISGLDAGVIHISALTPTTRQTHAARHGNAYTVSDQNAWWDEGVNRINCKCTVETVLIDASGKVIEKG